MSCEECYDLDEFPVQFAREMHASNPSDVEVFKKVNAAGLGALSRRRRESRRMTICCVIDGSP